MISQQNKDLAKWAMNFALKNGCQACQVGIYAGTENSYEIRDKQIDKLQQASENQMSIRLYVDGCFGAITTNRIDKKELEPFIKNGIASTRLLAKDPFRELPNPDLYFKGNGDSLDTYDANYNTITAAQKLEATRNAVNEILESDKRIISVSGGYGDAELFSYITSSNGFEGENSSTNFSLSVGVSIKGEGDARPESYWYESSLFWNDLVQQNIGRKALERTLQKLGQRKVKSGKYLTIVDNMSAARLLSPMIAALNGAALQQKNSFLLDKLNTKVASEKLLLTDRPHLKHTPGARYFDNEGIATQERTVFENGILRTYFIDSYNARKLNTTPTINGPSTLQFQLGERNLKQLIADTPKAILITGFNGGNSNSATGDFSFGIEGFLIENGQLTQPINEMNITGNMIDLWNTLIEVGNDPRTNSSWQMPSLVFSSLNYSGL